MGAQVTTYSGVRQTARTALATMIAIPLGRLLRCS